MPDFLRKETIRTSGDLLQVEFWRVGMRVARARERGKLEEGTTPSLKVEILKVSIVKSKEKCKNT